MQLTDEADSAGSGTLMLHLLGRCNLRCLHCYMEGGPYRREMLAADAVVAAIGEAPGLGFGSLYVTGGEPTLYPYLDRVIEAAGVSDGMTRTLCSNGTRLTWTLVHRLAESGFRLNVSLDGTAPFHDSFRRLEGTFADTLRGINLAVDAGLRVTIIASIGRRNVSMLGFLAETALDVGAAAFRVQPLLALGRAHDLADDRLAPAELDAMIMALSDIANRTRGRLEVSLIGQSLRYLRAHPCAAYVCNGGGCHRRVAREIKKLVVREDGTMLPEATNLDPSYAIGTLGEAPLSALVGRYLDHDYDRFDALCRATYKRHIPDWPASIVPWDMVLASASREVIPLAPAQRTSRESLAPASIS
ncbi:MAG: radical SAM protein [Pseudomonadota bacterium]